MKRTITDYLVTYKRAGREPRTKRRCSEAALLRFLQLLGPEPWKVYAPRGTEGGDLMCCSGYECGCGGGTWEDASREKRAGFTPLQWVRIEARKRWVETTPWGKPVLNYETAAALDAIETFPDEPDGKHDAFVEPEEQS